MEFELTISIDRILEATLDSLAYNYQKIPAERRILPMCETIMEVSRVGMNKITSSTPRHRYQQNFGFEEAQANCPYYKFSHPFKNKGAVTVGGCILILFER